MVRVIGLCGCIGAGKGTVSKILQKKLGYSPITIGDVVREHVINLGLQPNRETTDYESKKMLEENGKFYWMNQVVKNIKEGTETKYLVDGVRLPSDDEILRNSFKNYSLILVQASERTRFNRLKNRKRLGDPDTIQEFREQEERQILNYQVDETFSKADYVINNEDISFKELEKVIDEFLEKYIF